MNDQVTKPVGRKTVESLIKPEHAEALAPQPYFFCDAPDCDTVYVSALGDHLVTKDMLKVRVGIKETEDRFLNETKFSLNIPIGFQRRLGRGEPLLSFQQLQKPYLSVSSLSIWTQTGESAVSTLSATRTN